MQSFHPARTAILRRMRGWVVRAPLPVHGQASRVTHDGAGLFVGVPVKLGARGIEQIYQIKLNADEQAMLKKSADAVKELVDVIKSKM